MARQKATIRARSGAPRGRLCPPKIPRFYPYSLSAGKRRLVVVVWGHVSDRAIATITGLTL